MVDVNTMAVKHSRQFLRYPSDIGEWYTDFVILLFVLVVVVLGVGRVHSFAGFE